MEHFGWLSILPPLLTIVLALITKDVVLSLFLGIMSGTLIATGGNIFAATMLFSDKLISNLGDGWNLRIFLFCALLGSLVGLLARTGAAQAFGSWMSGRVRSKTGTLLCTSIFGMLVFIDDYFNSLAVGTAMRPVSDRMKISRAKLSYILDSTAAPVCILAPVSTWVVTVMSYMRGTEGFDQLNVSELSYFLQTIPYNIYAILTLIMVVTIAITRRDFGPMLKSELRAEEGKLFDVDTYGDVTSDLENMSDEVNELGNAPSVKPFDMILPMLLLIGTAVAAFPITTWWTAAAGEGGPASFMEAFRTIPLKNAFIDTDASVALMLSIIVTLAVTYPYMIFRRLFDLRRASDAFVSGMKSMVPALIILAMAWTIGAIIRDVPADGGIGLPKFIAELVERTGMTAGLMPLGFFIISALIAFSTGTSWGTMAIMIPISMPVSMAIAQTAGVDASVMLAQTLATSAAVMGGAVLGDHTSPISDTTILSAIGANCPLLEHVTTQAPYAIFVAACSALGYLLIGFTDNVWLGWIVAVAVFGFGLWWLWWLPRLMLSSGKR